MSQLHDITASLGTLKKRYKNILKSFPDGEVFADTLATSVLNTISGSTTNTLEASVRGIISTIEHRDSDSKTPAIYHSALIINATYKSEITVEGGFIELMRCLPKLKEYTSHVPTLQDVLNRIQNIVNEEIDMARIVMRARLIADQDVRLSEIMSFAVFIASDILMQLTVSDDDTPKNTAVTFRELVFQILPAFTHQIEIRYLLSAVFLASPKTVTGSWLVHGLNI
jgi:hypothetical protein